MSSAETARVAQPIHGIPAGVPMPRTQGRAYTFLRGLGYEPTDAAAVALGRQPCPRDLAARYTRRAAVAHPGGRARLAEW